MEWILVVLLVPLLLLGAAFPFYYMRRLHTKRQAEVQLRAPLLDSEDHRVDAALREAESGFYQCAACGFDNFKRALHCTICGEAIVDPTRVIDPKKQKLLAKQDRKKASRKQPPPPPEDEQADASREQQNATRARRQRRTRKRKEWQRKFDVKGRMFWYRASGTRCDSHSSVDSSTKLRFPGYVLEIQSICVSRLIDPTPDDDTTTDAAMEDATSDFGSLVTEEEEDEQVQMDLPEPRTVADRVVALATAFDTVQLDLVDTQTAQADRLPTMPTPLTDPQMLEVISLFRRDFPTKYAHFVAHTAGLIVPASVAHLRLNVSRELMYEDSIASFAVIRRRHLRSVIRINFWDESGIDAGGVHREWFLQLVEKIVHPATGLFVCVDRTEQTYYLNPHSHKVIGGDHLVHFFAVGRLLGRALLEGYATGFHLTLPLLKVMLGVPVSFSDLEFFDPETYKNMLWMLEHDGVDDLGLDFSVVERTTAMSDEVVVTDLIPHGRNVAVTDANKMLFLERKFKYMLFEGVERQLFALLKGLHDVVPQELLMIFDPEEFDHVLCGSDEIDVDDWEEHTKYTADLHDHPARKWFWELVREMPNEYRRRLLLFATGTSRVPIAGFGALTSYDGRLCPFTLNGVALVNDGYIIGHACFNRIDLPRHVVRDELKAVLYATLETDQYGFTTD